MDKCRLPRRMPPINSTGLLDWEKFKEELEEADTILIICFDQDYKWAHRQWSHLSKLKSCKLMSSPQAKRIFLIGPKDVGNGDFELPGFSHVVVTNGDSISSLEESLV
jgi:hypothetical protein